ncbi:response regulator [Micromonospora sp. STR1s_5]|nr:response regulator [Micromonospora sp. STR1s_5]
MLVVEDDALVRWLVIEMFEEAGYEVIEAGSGDEALNVLACRPDIGVVFTDVHMPGETDGIALAWHLGATRPGCAVVLASGRGLAEALELPPGTRYLPKPFTGEKAAALVNELLA